MAKITRPICGSQTVAGRSRLSNAFQTVLTNRNVKLLYIDLGVYLVSTWKKIGIGAEHKLEESATRTKTRLHRDFELIVDPSGSSTGEPDQMFNKFITGAHRD